MKFIKSILVCSLLLSSSVFAAAVNVNTASADEIAASLKGIGVTKAAAIFEHCQAVKCQKAEDLLVVKGIGEKTLEKISADLVFSEN